MNRKKGFRSGGSGDFGHCSLLPFVSLWLQMVFLGRIRKLSKIAVLSWNLPCHELGEEREICGACFLFRFGRDRQQVLGAQSLDWLL